VQFLIVIWAFCNGDRSGGEYCIESCFGIFEREFFSNAASKLPPLHQFDRSQPAFWASTALPINFQRLFVAKFAIPLID
jgi:hypothetical protein